MKTKLKETSKHTQTYQVKWPNLENSVRTLPQYRLEICTCMPPPTHTRAYMDIETHSLLHRQR